MVLMTPSQLNPIVLYLMCNLIIYISQIIRLPEFSTGVLFSCRQVVSMQGWILPITGKVYYYIKRKNKVKNQRGKRENSEVIKDS